MSSSQLIKDRSGPVIFGKTIKERTPWGSLYVTLNFDGGKPFETFITVGKSGSELKAMMEALSRIISIALRSGCPLEAMIDTLKGLSGREYWMFDHDDEHTVRSIPDAVALLLEKLSGTAGEGLSGSSGPVQEEDAQAEAAAEGAAGNSHDELVCPECGSPMELISGCSYCFSCGYSPCK